MEEILELQNSVSDNQALDDLELMILAGHEVVEFPLIHRFTPGVYSREIFMPKDSLLTSKIHKTEHQFIILTGKVVVTMPGDETELFEAGHIGITKPGTRRALYIQEDCRWITFHPLSESEEESRTNGETDENLVSMIEERIIQKTEIPGLNGKNVYDLYQEKLALQKEGSLTELDEGGQ